MVAPIIPLVFQAIYTP